MFQVNRKPDVPNTLRMLRFQYEHAERDATQKVLLAPFEHVEYKANDCQESVIAGVLLNEF